MINMKFRDGLFNFTYNVGNGDVRIYDIYRDGQIREKSSKTNDIRFISTDEAVRRLDAMIILAEKEKERFEKVMLYDKISKTKLDVLLTIKRFMYENEVSDKEVRYF